MRAKIAVGLAWHIRLRTRLGETWVWELDLVDSAQHISRQRRLPPAAMGIAGVAKFLSKHAPACMRPTTSASIRACNNLAVDVPVFMHALIHADPTCDLTAGAMLLFDPIAKRGGTFIFDGSVPRPQKAPARARRLQARAKLEDEVRQIEARVASTADAEAAHVGRARLASLKKRVVAPSDAQIRKTIDAMRAANWDVRIAKNDAEELAAALVREGACAATYTCDSDAIVWASPKTILKVGKDRLWYEIDHARLLQDLRLTEPQFVDLAILMGSDFTHETLRGVGPEKAYKHILAYGSIEDVLEAVERGRVKLRGSAPSATEFDYPGARRVFAQLSAGSLEEASETAAPAAKRARRA